MNLTYKATSIRKLNNGQYEVVILYNEEPTFFERLIGHKRQQFRHVYVGNIFFYNRESREPAHWLVNSYIEAEVNKFETFDNVQQRS